MPKRTLLVAIDFSSASEAAVEFAAALARSGGQRLLMVHVQDAVVPVVGEDTSLLDPQQLSAQRRLQRLVPADLARSSDIRLLRGQAVRELVALTADERIEAIVLGSCGRSDLARWLIGSVTQGVMQQAACPVLVVHRRAPA